MNGNAKVIALSLLVVGATSCKPRTYGEAGVKEAQRFDEAGRSIVPGFSLRNLEQHFTKAGVPIPKYRADLVRLTLPGANIDPSSQNSLDVIFENLTLAQCQTLRSAYYRTDIACGENGIFPWDNRRYVYTIKDFLSPVMQATLKLTFKPEQKNNGNEPFTNEFGRQSRSVVTALEANCWSTAYEVSRQETRQYTVHVIQSEDADKIFKNPGYTKFVFSGDASGLQNAVQKGGLGRFGELLIVRNINGSNEGESSLAKGRIAHAAVFVDSDLLFERVGNAGHLPMRLARLKDVLASYPDSAFTYEIRQVLQPFPHVTQIPGLKTVNDSSSEGTYSRSTIGIKDFNLERISWEYRLPEEAFAPILK